MRKEGNQYTASKRRGVLLAAADALLMWTKTNILLPLACMSKELHLRSIDIYWLSV